MPSADALTEALAECRVVTVPSLRLATLLERRAGVPLAASSRACPNSIAFGEAPLREPRRPAAILLTQGHRLALTASQHEVLGAIATFAARRKLSLWYLCSPPAAFLAVAASTGARSRVLRPRSYVQYHSSLATGPVLLGVAPLESRGDSETNEFVSGKSDIKMVEYGGFGHPAVLTASRPMLTLISSPSSRSRGGRLSRRRGWKTWLTRRSTCDCTRVGRLLHLVGPIGAASVSRRDRQARAGV